MDIQTIKERIVVVQTKRDYLLSLLEQPNLGTLRIDVNQALEELDELIDEFRRTIPGTEI
jgi:predicted regulator of Ras-like GTPase activity (Roadblock/LC7/MglB family)